MLLRSALVGCPDQRARLAGPSRVDPERVRGEAARLAPLLAALQPLAVLRRRRPPAS